MKKLSILVLVAVMGVFSLSGCKKGSGELMYDRITALTWVQANVNQGDKRVIWFQLLDSVDKKEKVKESYARRKDKIAGKYPATISDRMIWTLINDRFEIRLFADSKNKAYQKKEKLVAFVESFDLDGLAGVTGDKKKGKDLKAFIPKLKEKSK